MAGKYQSFPGMDDILPGASAKWQWLENRARIFFESRGFAEIRTPVLEPTELFIRSIGETSDIVHKEMYTFEDRGGRSMTLRPELTASVARSVVQHGLLKTAPCLRLYYTGPMFRAERPQAGRKRQFHQIGAELVNDASETADLEIISALYDFLSYLGLQGHRLRINDLSAINGSEGEQVKTRLRSYLESHRDRLDADSLYRLDKNVLRIFDSKNEDMQEILAATPWEEIAPLSEGFREVMLGLEAQGIAFEVNRRLVRGLDYYTGTVFEISAPGLGAQDAVAGGGRYDRLYQELGSKNPVPCTGFSIGMERLLMSLEEEGSAFGENPSRKIHFALLCREPEALRLYRRIALKLRESGAAVETAFGQTSLSSHLKKANQAGARWMIILGDEELKKNTFILKDMEQRQQEELAEDEIYIRLLQGATFI